MSIVYVCSLEQSYPCSLGVEAKIYINLTND